jgi:hypothetical protein
MAQFIDRIITIFFKNIQKLKNNAYYIFTCNKINLFVYFFVLFMKLLKDSENYYHLLIH